MGIFIGSGLALIVGGAVVDATVRMPAVTLPILGLVASWRLTFLIVGIPGLLVALWLINWIGRTGNPAAISPSAK